MHECKDVIYIGIHSWDFLWYRRQQIVSVLAVRGYRILYVNPPRKWSLKKLLLNVFKSSRSLAKINDNILVFSAYYVFPLNRFEIFRKLNILFIISALRKILAKHAFSNPILMLNYLNYAKGYIGAFNESITCYDSADAYWLQGKSSDRKKNISRDIDEELARKSDIVFVTSEMLYRQKKKINPNTYLIPNGVSVDFIKKVSSGKIEIPADVLKIPKPIIGYFGAIKNNTDFDLLEYLAKNSNRWSLVLAGQIRDDRITKLKVDKLRGYSNIYFLDEQKYFKLPAYLRVFDICIMPYILSEYSEYIDPIKIYEYLAAGKPIVSTNIYAVRRFKKFVRIVESYQEFQKSISDILNGRDHVYLEEQRQMAMAHTWEVRVTTMRRVISYYLTRRTGNK